jgi:hypothetical protein
MTFFGILPGMGLFGNGHGECRERQAALEARMAALEKIVRTARDEIAEVSARAYRYMKSAESRERRALDAQPNQEPRAGAAPAGETPAARPGLVLTGARARRAMRLQRPDPRAGLNGTNGEDSD